jgi:hypothetical protein
VNPVPTPIRPLHAKAEPTPANPEAEDFYREAIGQLVASAIPFLLAGTYALSAYTGIRRQTKDIDIFCRAGDYPRILSHFKKLGHRISIEDDRWLGKVFKGRSFIDVVFASSNGMPIGDGWFEHARQTLVFGTPVHVVGPTELVWSKCFIQARYRYDGADVAHLVLKAHDQIDWRRLLAYFDGHWEALLSHLLNFRWIYPSERNAIPDWLLDELLERLAAQRRQPPPAIRICRGRVVSREDYQVDVEEWGFAEVDSSARRNGLVSSEPDSDG